MSGNATANRSIHIYATNCNYEENQDLESIFVVDLPNIKPSDVNFEWKGFDTLIIRYRKELRIFKQETESKTVNPKIIFEYIAE